MSELKWAENKMPKSDDKNAAIMSIDEVKKQKHFIKVFLNTHKHHYQN
nr:hypothetical protein [Brachyspira sp. SAP_772]